MPGSCTPGIPASVTSATVDPSRSSRSTSSVFCSSLCWKKLVRWRVDVEVAEELARAARVLGRDELGLTQRVQDAGRDVPEIADRCGADVQHGHPSFRNRSMNRTSTSRPRTRAWRRAAPTTEKPSARW